MNPTMNCSFYRAYEDRHRGSRELIKSRLHAYAAFLAPFLTPLAALRQRPMALDLGCGRGEWLELLGEAGFDASGVDVDEGMLAACRERFLKVGMADALTSLRALPDASLALVSAFHLVEHLEFSQVRALVGEALRVLQPGGLLIMETPNPENLVVGATSFYMDPSHVRPLPPQLLGFVVDFCGFRRHRVLRLQEPARLHTAAPVRLIDVLDGVSPDYAVLAQKDAGAAVLAPFDAPFGAACGMLLDTLAQRYDAQAEARLAQLGHDLVHGLAQAEARAAQDGQQLDSRLARMEERLAQAERQLHAVFFSRSWRITAPPRALAGALRRIAGAVRDGRIISGASRRIAPLLRGAALALLRRPRASRAVLGALDRLPGLRRRLRAMVRGPASGPAAANAAAAAGSSWSGHTGDLAPRALQMYTQLNRMMDGEKS